MNKKEKDRLKRVSVIFLVLLFILLLGMTLTKYSFSDKCLVFFPEKCFDVNSEECFNVKPYYCNKGEIIKKPSLCGCPENFSKKGDFCESKFKTNPKNITLKYILNGKEKKVNFLVYKEVDDYFSNKTKRVVSSSANSSKDFELTSIENKIQKSFLFDLVAKINNIADSEKDYVRISTSIVQNIPYETSKKEVFFKNRRTNSSKYPYEVLYNLNGSCQGKVDLLAFLLKEAGFGVAIFSFTEEKHDVIGIKCPTKESYKNTGYCFIETTKPSVISNHKNYYSGGNLESNPRLIEVAKGKSLEENLEEYEDADFLERINKKIIENGEITRWEKIELERLKEKYGLDYMYE